MQGSRSKLLVMGFDGLDYELFKQRGPAGLEVLPLYSPVPVTGPAWTSIYTGDSTTTHGVRNVYGLETRRRYARNELLHWVGWYGHQLFRLLRFKPLHRRYVTRARTQSKYIWDTLSAAGVRVKVVAMPITCPVRKVNGIHVGGFPVVTRKAWCYPAELSEKVPADYAKWCDIIHCFQDPELHSHRHWKRRLKAMGLEGPKKTLAENTEKLAAFFLSLPGADLEMIQFSFIDRLGHVFGMGGAPEEFCYDMVLRLIRNVGDAVRPEAMMVISDHGFQGDAHTDYGALGLGGTIRDLIHLPAGYTPTVLDVAPTIGGLFGVPHLCEGNDLTGVGPYVTRPREEDEREKADIMGRLRELGYL